MPKIIKLTPTETSPEELKLTTPSILDVVIVFITTLIFLPASVPPIFTGDAVTIGGYLNSGLN
jgi:hypothetical protein